MRNLAAFVLLVAACTGGAQDAGSRAAPAGCADVVAAEARRDADGTWTFSATVRSDDTGWDKYADLWVVRVGDTVVGERPLAHPHENEQPFTRSVAGVHLPPGTDEVEIAARDSVVGFCGDVYRLPIEERAPQS